ncbi:MFS transporter [Abyssisolibacter fermentans]|uniref:MFS transporter n=1 Tax=Abyssisolibacter fermentans TaxID=1766203 RepID=UPI0008355865|nr:MFS transporter [Abyssisolibacter fermentans]
MKFKVKSNIWKLYGYYFFHNFILAYVIERLYWQQRGMSIQQVVYTEIIYAVIIIILEVPTGYWADAWSRKNLIVIGSILTCLEFIILIYACEFWHFAFAVGVAAVQKALCSGATNALLYDSLKVINYENDFEKILGRIRFFDYTAATLAALMGSILGVKLGFVSNYWLSLVSTIISLVFAIMLIEPNINKRECECRDKEYIKQSIDFLKGHKSVRFVLLIGIFIGANIVYLDEFWQIYLNEINIPVIFFGLISSLNSIIVSISSLCAYKIKGRFDEGKLFLILIIIFSFSFILMSFTKSINGLFFIALIYGSSGIIQPLVSGYLHHRIESSYRATIESFQSLALRVMTMTVGLVFGKIASKFSIFEGFRFIGVVSIVYLVYYAVNKSKNDLNVKARKS